MPDRFRARQTESAPIDKMGLTETSPRARFPGGIEMIHALLVLAVILFVLWLLFHATGGLVNLIWIAIIVLVVLWLFGFVRGRSTR
jgi:hypothetical protein